MTTSSWIESLSVFVLLTSNVIAPATDQTVLMEEASSQWRILEKAGSQLETTYTLTVRYQKEETITRMNVLIGGRDHVRIDAEELKKGSSKTPPTEKILGINPSYAFQMTRKVGAKEYTLEYIGPDRGNIEKYLTAMIAGHSGIPWSFYKNLSSLVQDSGFHLQRITREQQEGKDIIKMVARYTPSDSKEGAISDIDIIMDPGRHWCILSFSFRESWGRVIGTVDYGPDDQAFPVPVRYTMTQNYDKGGQTVYETAFENWKYRRDGIPEKDFYLSAFGLPEPMGVKPLPPSRNWLWLLAAAVGASALAFVFAWLKRRQVIAVRASPPAPSDRRTL